MTAIAFVGLVATLVSAEARDIYEGTLTKAIAAGEQLLLLDALAPLASPGDTIVVDPDGDPEMIMAGPATGTAHFDAHSDAATTTDAAATVAATAVATTPVAITTAATCASGKWSATGNEPCAAHTTCGNQWGTDKPDGEARLTGESTTAAGTCTDCDTTKGYYTKTDSPNGDCDQPTGFRNRRDDTSTGELQFIDATFLHSHKAGVKVYIFHPQHGIDGTYNSDSKWNIHTGHEQHQEDPDEKHAKSSTVTVLAVFMVFAFIIIIAVAIRQEAYMKNGKLSPPGQTKA